MKAHHDAALAQTKYDEANAHLYDTLNHIAYECAAAEPHPMEVHHDDDATTKANGDLPHLGATLLQHEAMALLNLHAKAIMV
jgi:hypothetical protein